MSSTDVDATVPAQTQTVAPETPDEIISASVRSLLAHHGLKRTDVPNLIEGMKKSTLYNRLGGGEKSAWEAREVQALAELFGLEVGQLYSGHFQAIDSRLAGHPVRLSREHEPAGQDRFSGSDIEFLIDAAIATSAA